jgi:hypothetical protein
LFFFVQVLQPPLSQLIPVYRKLMALVRILGYQPCKHMFWGCLLDLWHLYSMACTLFCMIRMRRAGSG